MHRSPTHPSSHTLTAIPYPPFQHPVDGYLASVRRHMLVHISPCHTPLSIPALAAHFFSLSWSGLSLCFVLWDLLYVLWLIMPVLEKVLCSRIHRCFSPAAQTKTISLTHLCSAPSTVPPKALNTCCRLQARCDSQMLMCWICYPSLHTRAQPCTTQGSLLALSRGVQ